MRTVNLGLFALGVLFVATIPFGMAEMIFAISHRYSHEHFLFGFPGIFIGMYGAMGCIYSAGVINVIAWIFTGVSLMDRVDDVESAINKLRVRA